MKPEASGDHALGSSVRGVLMAYASAVAGWKRWVAAAGVVLTGCSFEVAGIGPVDGGTPNSYDCSCDCTRPAGNTGAQVSSSFADVEEQPDGTIRVGSSDIELVTEAAVQVDGLWFGGVAIPPGATIASAYLQFTASAADSGATSLSIRVQDSDNPPIFTGAAFNVTSRPLAAGSVGWVPAAWLAAGDSGAAQQSPDLSALIQAQVNRPGWASGNAIAFVISGTGRRTAVAWDTNPAQAARLEVVYTLPGTTVRVAACMPANLNPNLNGGTVPSDADLTADCQNRVDTTISGLASACGYPDQCECAVVPSTTVLAAVCNDACVETPLAAGCTNFDPEGGTVTATNAPGDTPVCLSGSPLSSALYGHRSACEVSGTATISADDESETTSANGRIEFEGGPCPGGSCSVGMKYRLALGDVTFESLFSSATFRDLAAVGETVPGQEGLLADTGLGSFGPLSTQTTARGRRGSESRGYLGTNDDSVGFGLDGIAKTCSLGGSALGSANPELHRCVNAGPTPNAVCTTDAECGTDPACGEDEVCHCVAVETANVTVSLAVSGTLVNQPPVVNAGADQTVECGETGVGRFTLAATNTDPDGNAVLNSWFVGSRSGPELADGRAVNLTQAVGTTQSYVARVIDAAGQSDEDTTQVQVVDTTPPVLGCNAPPTITPPSTAVSFTASASDVCDASVPAQVTGYTCYRINGSGKTTDFTDSCRVSSSGGTVTIRNSNGIDHHVVWSLRAEDDSGNVTTKTCEVAVVKN